MESNTKYNKICYMIYIIVPVNNIIKKDTDRFNWDIFSSSACLHYQSTYTSLV